MNEVLIDQAKIIICKSSETDQAAGSGWCRESVRQI